MRYFVLLLWSFSFSIAQPIPTDTLTVTQSLALKAQMAKQSLVKNLPLHNIGPDIMSGRVVDLAVNPNNALEFYVAYASGGLWHTTDNGISFKAVLDNAPTLNIGAIAVHWASGTIWVGTGEHNASRSSYAGIGLLKSTDKGANWQSIGLTDSHHIGRILINPENPDEVVVGVTGHLYSPNKERGLYKTTDGGLNWQQTLFIDEVTGIIDLVQAPDNFNLQYAAAWQKDRKAWNFTGNGESSGIYKSVDAGEHWELITTAESGFPVNKGVGRIGIAVFDEQTIYAVLDNQNRRTPAATNKKLTNKVTKDRFRTMDNTTFLALDTTALNDYLRSNYFPKKYTAITVKAMVREGTAKPKDLATYSEDANSILFDTPVIGAEVYRSNDGGLSWTLQNEGYIDDLYYSYGYYFGRIWVAPQDKETLYLGGVPLLRSTDGGRTFEAIGKENVHSDHHSLWIDPKQPNHLINGNDGGVNITYNGGQVWMKNNSPNVGQFYAINVDYQTPYQVYGGLQDNGVWKGAHNSEDDYRWQAEGTNPWQRLLGGDGMQVQIDSRDANIVFTGFQFGNYYRLNLASGFRKAVRPWHKLGEAPYRFNWQTPILLSPHNQDILYLGSNKLHRSFDQGDNWKTISGDLTQGGKAGNVAYGTITTISESPLKFGLLYVGTDDGQIQVSRDNGDEWDLISTSLPKDLWVSEVAASQHQEGRVYAALNGYRWDNFTPYLYQSDDYGATWTNIAKGIPPAPVNAFVEDPANENLLFVGTDNGLYVSFDQGAHWDLLNNNMPGVAVHDLVIQADAKHLLIGTHGRSIYKVDIAVLQQMTPTVLSQPLTLFDIAPLEHSNNWGNGRSTWNTPNTPGVDLFFYTSKAGEATASIATSDGITVSAVTIPMVRGINILSYDVAFSKAGKKDFLRKRKTSLKMADNGKTYLPKGNYQITLRGNNNSQSTPLEIVD
ncbi:MAG: glycosyl hydrolase [Bacteroidota bacterium]